MKKEIDYEVGKEFVVKTYPRLMSICNNFFEDLKKQKKFFPKYRIKIIRVDDNHNLSESTMYLVHGYFDLAWGIRFAKSLFNFGDPLISIYFKFYFELDYDNKDLFSEEIIETAVFPKAVIQVNIQATKPEEYDLVRKYLAEHYVAFSMFKSNLSKEFGMDEENITIIGFESDVLQ